MYQAIVTMSPDSEGCSPLEYQRGVQSWGRHLLEQSYPATVLVGIADGVNYHRFVCGLEDANWVIFDSIMVWNYPPERVVIARSPRQGLTYSQCLEQFKTGSLNIDETRIPVGDEQTLHPPLSTNVNDGYRRKWHDNERLRQLSIERREIQHEKRDSMGRWGANTILVHHPNCSDELCVDSCHVHIMGEQSGQMKSTKSIISDNRSQEYYGLGNGGHSGTHTPLNSHNDTGTASRFFYQGRSRQDVMDYLVTMIRPPTENPSLLIQTERIAE